MSLRFTPRDRRVELYPVDGVAAPCPPSRLWVSWPWEPFLTIGSSVFLVAALALLTVPLPFVEAAVVAIVAVAGLAGAVLGVAISLVRRRRQVLGFRHASMALLGERYR